SRALTRSHKVGSGPAWAVHGVPPKINRRFVRRHTRGARAPPPGDARNLGLFAKNARSLNEVGRGHRRGLHGALLRGAAQFGERVKGRRRTAALVASRRSRVVVGYAAFFSCGAPSLVEAFLVTFGAPFRVARSRRRT